jgi:16S rRNA C1402 (ribose-2'-O) methylase RsmI
MSKTRKKTNKISKMKRKINKICTKVKMILVFMARNLTRKKEKCKIMQTSLMKKNSKSSRRKLALLVKAKSKNKAKWKSNKKFLIK